jgi:AraC family transcriptional regulator
MFEKLLPGCSHGKTLKSLEVAEFIITENIHPAGGEISEHAHENAHFCFVLQGSYSEFDGRRELLCKPSTLTFRPPGEVHRDYFYDRDVRVFIIEIPPKWIEKLRDQSIRLGRAEEFKGGPLPQLVARLNREFHQTDAAASLIIEGLTLELMAEAARYSAGGGGQKIPCWLKQAEALIRAHFSENLRLEQLASEVGVHPVHLATVFRRKYHLTVGEYIRRLRIEYACLALAQGEKPLGTIALEAGFANQSHFSGAFKRMTGFTPAAYRNSFLKS